MAEAAREERRTLTPEEQDAARRLVRQATCLALKANLPKERMSTLRSTARAKSPQEQIEDFLVDKAKSQLEKAPPTPRRTANKIAKLVDDVNDQTSTDRAVYVGVVELTCDVLG